MKYKPKMFTVASEIHSTEDFWTQVIFMEKNILKFNKHHEEFSNWKSHKVLQVSWNCALLHSMKPHLF